MRGTTLAAREGWSTVQGVGPAHCRAAVFRSTAERHCRLPSRASRSFWHALCSLPFSRSSRSICHSGGHVMGEITAAAQTVARRVKEAPDHWVATLARLGYATIGIVYLMIGTLATQAALGTGGAIADTRDVLVTIARQPFGRVLLGLTALGLSGYVLWRFVQACFDAERKGTDVRGLLTRLGYAVSGVAYAALAMLAAQMALGTGRAGGHAAEQEWTA